MDVCILSMQMVDNYGSVLQAYALKSMIESLGNRVEFIDIRRNDAENELADGTNHQTAGVAKAKIDKYFFTRISNRMTWYLLRRKLSDFREDNLDIGSHKINCYDTCVIGSDEVFNCMQEAPWGFNSQLFGNVENVNKVITYAACCGATKYEMLNDKMIKCIGSALHNLQAISVRDKNTHEFVKAISDRDSVFNLDPALVYDFSKLIEKPSMHLPDKFCLIYSYGNRFSTSSEVKAIKEFCKNHGYEIVIAFGMQPWTRKFYAFSPFELLYVFGQAEFVITDTFHGTIFSAKYAKRFATICRASNNNKLYDLIQRIGIEKQMISSMYDLEKAYKSAPDRNRIDKIIIKERKRTMEYLEEKHIA